MNQLFSVKITEEALADLSAIYEFYSKERNDSKYGIALYQRLTEAILTLEQFSFRFAIFEGEPEHSMKIRRMVVQHHLICYVADSTSVTVIAVFYSAADIHRQIGNRKSL